jgi:glycogen(starch) synthase
MSKNMILLTWEFPPRNIGPISHYSKTLADEISKHNNVVVLTYDDSNPNRFEIENDNQFVFTFGNPIPGAYNPLVWALTMSAEMEKKAVKIFNDVHIDFIHAQDWLTIPAAITVKNIFEIPLFLTLHSIEPVRVGGNIDPYIEAVKRIEYEGCRAALMIFVNNLWLKYQVMYHYSVPEEKIVVLPGDGWAEELVQCYEKEILGVNKIEGA